MTNDAKDEDRRTTEESDRPWPLWRKLLAYATLALLAIFSIWLIDRKVNRLGPIPPHTSSNAAARPQEGLAIPARRIVPPALPPIVGRPAEY